jgi:peptidyl-prolyl cis-trans isomerase SurA
MKRSIKKSLLLGAAFVAFFTVVKAQSTTDPVLMTVGNDKITLSEFKYIFTKNSSDTKITKESLDEYMELFIKFKLKVKEAKDMKMDTIASFRNELNGYVDQLAVPYLKDKEAEGMFVKEIYDRSKSDLKIRHILVSLPACPTPADTLAAWNNIMKIRKDIMKSKNFEEAAKKLSQDTSSSKNGGLLGYFTVMTLFYPYETEAYKLKAGEVSNPVRTSQGYHLIKVDEIRPARGKIKVAHIFVRTDKNDEATNKKAKTRIEEAYAKLNNKEDWNAVTKNYSEDLKTGPSGGELQEFGINQMVQEFEDAAFGLKNVGDYSAPFESPYGWHIVKLVSKPKQSTFEEAKPEIEKAFGKSKRFDYVKHAFVSKLKKDYNVVENKDFLKKLEEVAVNNKMNLDKSILMKYSNMTLFTYKGGEVKSTELISSVTDKLADGKTIDFCTFKKKNYEEFVTGKLMTYKKAQLPNENYEFKMLVNEYTEGILLFNLMDQNVWTKSVKDTTGLKAFHEKNKDKYMWGERAQVYIVDLKNDTVEKAARKLAPKVLAGKMTKDKFIATLNKKVKDNVFIIDGLYSKGDNTMVENVGFQPGISATEKKDGKIRFAIVYKIRPAEPKSLKEAKGLIISDYQTYLEEEWIRTLRGKYPVTVNKEVLYSLITK